MSNLIKHDLDDDTVKWTEHELQVAVVTRLKQIGVLYAADQNGLRTSKRQGALAKQAGMMAGEPDIRIYLPGGRIIFVEMKTTRGSVSAAQRQRHKDLADLGHIVYVVKEASPIKAQNCVESICLYHDI